MKKVLFLALFLIAAFVVYAEGQKIITVLDFETSGVSEKEMSLFVDYLSSSVSDYEGYILIDRSQREIILAEAEFSNSGCADDSCAIEIGQLLSANEMIVGSLGSIGSRYLLNIKLIDIQTGKVSNDVSGKYNSIEELVDGSGKIIQALFIGETLVNNNNTTDEIEDNNSQIAAKISISKTIEFFPSDELFGKDSYEYLKTQYYKEGTSGYIQLVNVIDDVCQDEMKINPDFPESLNEQIKSYQNKIVFAKIGWWSSIGAMVGSSVLGSIAFTNLLDIEGTPTIDNFISDPLVIPAGLLFWAGIAGLFLSDGAAGEPREIVTGYNRYYQ